ncbi:4a-hydroxytetrahydrobiopterin dehydratase [Candidatus Pacearchaeota archaeon]|nr:4a-hydroxytetrahydrobiopterin dehydratase [Candidatus Pacearchaeota archaeon]
MVSLIEIQREMQDLSNWSIEENGNAIVKDLSFSNFKESIDFVNKVAEVAEKHSHHPDIIVNYNTVRLSLTTHSLNSLTKKDFEVAREIDKL